MNLQACNPFRREQTEAARMDRAIAKNLKELSYGE